MALKCYTHPMNFTVKILPCMSPVILPYFNVHHPKRVLIILTFVPPFIIPVRHFLQTIYFRSVLEIYFLLIVFFIFLHVMPLDFTIMSST